MLWEAGVRHGAAEQVAAVNYSPLGHVRVEINRLRLRNAPGHYLVIARVGPRGKYYRPGQVLDCVAQVL